MKLLASITVMALAGSVVAVAEGMPVQGAFAVAYTGTANTGGASYCDQTGTILPIAVEAHGDGFTSLGGLSFSLQKGIGFDGTLHGCLTLTAPNGDTLTAVYTGQGGATNTNNFSPAAGMIVFTGGPADSSARPGVQNLLPLLRTSILPATILSGAPRRCKEWRFTYSREGSLFRDLMDRCPDDSHDQTLPITGRRRLSRKTVRARRFISDARFTDL